MTERRGWGIRGLGAAIGAGSVFALVIQPTSAGAEERLPTANGDGILSDAEAAALNALPIDEVGVDDLLDVRPPDLPRLDSDLAAAIQTPVVEVTEQVVFSELPSDAQAALLAEGFGSESTSDTSFEDPQMAARLAEYRDWYTWKKSTQNVFGAELTRFYLNIEWSYNNKTITTDPKVLEWGSGSWGWTICDHDSSGGYRTSTHKIYDVTAYGQFGPVGCVSSMQQLVINADVHYDGLYHPIWD